MGHTLLKIAHPRHPFPWPATPLWLIFLGAAVMPRSTLAANCGQRSPLAVLQDLLQHALILEVVHDCGRLLHAQAPVQRLLTEAHSCKGLGTSGDLLRKCRDGMWSLPQGLGGRPAAAQPTVRNRSSLL